MTAKRKGSVPVPLRRRVVDAVLSLGPCTPAEVIGRVGRHIPAAQAVVAGRAVVRRERKRGKRRYSTYTAAQLIALGVRDLVGENLRRALKQGKLRRLTLGVFAPPEPKLFQESSVPRGA